MCTLIIIGNNYCHVGCSLLILLPGNVNENAQLDGYILPQEYSILVCAKQLSSNEALRNCMYVLSIPIDRPALSNLAISHSTHINIEGF